jgi:hypothetical protein
MSIEGDNKATRAGQTWKLEFAAGYLAPPCMGFDEPEIAVRVVGSSIRVSDLPDTSFRLLSVEDAARAPRELHIDWCAAHREGGYKFKYACKPIESPNDRHIGWHESRIDGGVLPSARAIL